MQSPCLTCTRVKDPKNCEKKTCRVWSNWFLLSWEKFHSYWESVTKGGN